MPETRRRLYTDACALLAARLRAGVANQSPKGTAKPNGSTCKSDLIENDPGDPAFLEHRPKNAH
jgi:hypothetical protein